MPYVGVGSVGFRVIVVVCKGLANATRFKSDTERCRLGRERPGIETSTCVPDP